MQRVHLFFGRDATALDALQSLADDFYALQPDVTRAMYGDHSPFVNGVFYRSTHRLHRDDVERLDSLLCTMHWWAWKVTTSPIHAKLRVVHGGDTYEADRRDDTVRSNLAFSLLDSDVFAASAVTIDTILRFFDEPPAMFWDADYPDVPKPEEMRPADVADLSERFIRYVIT